MAKAAVKVKEVAFAPDMELLFGLAKEGGSIDAADPGIIQHRENGYVETDGEVDDDGDAFYTLTNKGVEWVTANGYQYDVETAKEKPQASVLAKILPAQFSTELDDDLPTIRPSRVRESMAGSLRDLINFDRFAIGQSMHIAVTEKIPEPWKTYSSLVSTENSRHATQIEDENGEPVVRIRKNRNGEPKPYPVFSYSKRFSIFKAGSNDPRGPGARIKRVAVDSDE